MARAILTDRERELIAEETDGEEDRRYQAVSSVGSKADRLSEDVELLAEHRPDLLAKIRKAVGPTEFEREHSEGEGEAGARDFVQRGWNYGERAKLISGLDNCFTGDERVEIQRYLYRNPGATVDDLREDFSAIVEKQKETRELEGGGQITTNRAIEQEDWEAEIALHYFELSNVVDEGFMGNRPDTFEEAREILMQLSKKPQRFANWALTGEQHRERDQTVEWEEWRASVYDYIDSYDDENPDADIEEFKAAFERDMLGADDND